MALQPAGKPKSVIIKGDGIRKEREAAAVITPGQLVEVTSADKVQRHSTAGGFAQRTFAVEDDLQGNELDDNYVAANRVQYNSFHHGEEVLALLADGENVVIGDKLSSNGDGDLRKAKADSSATVVEDDVVCIALEAKDLSDSSGGDPSTRRLIVEIH